jgi:hypothetical protein
MAGSPGANSYKRDSKIIRHNYMGFGGVEGLSQNQLDRPRDSHNLFIGMMGGGVGGGVGVGVGVGVVVGGGVGGRNLNPAVSKDNNMYPQEEEGGAGGLNLQARRKSVAGKWLR